MFPIRLYRPWILEMLSPGKYRSMENRPSVTITFGLMISICSSRYGAHAASSSGLGSLFPGGLHFTTLVMKT